jgi:hypothetical protein
MFDIQTYKIESIFLNHPVFLALKVFVVITIDYLRNITA